MTNEICVQPGYIPCQVCSTEFVLHDAIRTMLAVGYYCRSCCENPTVTKDEFIHLCETEYIKRGGGAAAFNYLFTNQPRILDIVEEMTSTLEDYPNWYPGWLSNAEEHRLSDVLWEIRGIHKYIVYQIQQEKEQPQEEQPQQEKEQPQPQEEQPQEEQPQDKDITEFEMCYKCSTGYILHDAILSIYGRIITNFPELDHLRETDSDEWRKQMFAKQGRPDGKKCIDCFLEPMMTMDTFKSLCEYSFHKFGGGTIGDEYIFERNEYNQTPHELVTDFITHIEFSLEHDMYLLKPCELTLLNNALTTLNRIAEFLENEIKKYEIYYNLM